jgi:hypothetical protein
MTTRILTTDGITTLRGLERYVRRTRATEGLAGYEVGAPLVMRYGLNQVATSARMFFTDAQLVYDHGSGATSVPGWAEEFASALSDTGYDAAILCPMAGQPVALAYIDALRDLGITPVVECVMAYGVEGDLEEHPDGWIQHDGGIILDGSPHVLFDRSFEAGVRDFRVPTARPAIAADLMRYVVDGYTDWERAELTLWVPGRMRAAGDWWGAGAVVYVNGEIAKSRDAGEAARDFARVVSKKD